MKSLLTDLVRNAPSLMQAQNQVREYLQARILGTLQRSGAMVPLAFHGGTALRFLYAIPRYSEDLDFALEHSPSLYDFRAYLKAIQAEFMAEGYTVQIKVSDQKTVHSAFIRFVGLLYELALSPHTDQVLAVKLEVDTNPPQGAGLVTTILRRYVPLHLQHHDRPSLLAGKIHALLQRPYVKGRDLDDLFWYLSDPDWPEPNLILLNNALEQTGWTGRTPTPDTWRAMLRDRLVQLAWEHVLADVRPFVEKETDLALLTRENILKMLGDSRD
ncbi:MAG: nucleotidyl transferase AbiEii/AbiGii toxin family protein [Anaerolineae bacterium]|nr:nucleotidyl transferase AbiEii/AbiGii toxin family protein [Anaerolineae bacterium]